MKMGRHIRSWLYRGAGSVFLGVGIVGTVVPILPTTPFLLLAAGCYSRSSPRLANWLQNHPRLGPPLRAWQQQGAISPGAKLLAISTMAVSYGVVWWRGDMPLAALLALALTLTACAIFIASRPHPRGREPEVGAPCPPIVSQ